MGREANFGHQPIHASELSGKNRCSAMAKSGQRCRRFPKPGSDLCVWHAEGGPALPNPAAYKTEIKQATEDYQMDIPLTKRYQVGGRLKEIRDRQNLESNNILEATEEIEVLIARFQLLLEEAEELPQLTRAVYAAFNNWREAKASRNPTRYAEMTARLEFALEKCEYGHIANEEMYTLLESIRKARDTEMKRRIAMRAVMDGSDADKFFRVFQDALSEALTYVSSVDEQVMVKQTVVRHIARAFAPPGAPV